MNLENKISLTSDFSLATLQKKKKKTKISVKMYLQSWEEDFENSTAS
jgi:hypothetical protein